MSPALIKIFVIVVLVHIVGLNVIWVGFAAPKPTPKAAFFYDESALLEQHEVKVGASPAASGILLPSKALNNDASSWKILFKDKDNVRLGL